MSETPQDAPFSIIIRPFLTPTGGGAVLEATFKGETRRYPLTVNHLLQLQVAVAVGIGRILTAHEVREAASNPITEQEIDTFAALLNQEFPTATEENK